MKKSVGPAPLTLPLVFETAMKYEDFEEGVLAVQIDLAKKRQRASRFRSGLLITLVFGVGGGIGLSHVGAAHDPQKAIRPEWYVLGTIFFPIFVFGLFSMCLARHLNRKAEEPISFWLRAWRGTRALLPWMFILVCFLFIRWVRSLSPPPSPPREADWFGSLYPHAMWVVVTALYFIILARNAKPSVRRIWDLSPLLQRTNRVAIDPAGVTFEDGLVSRAYRWDAFVRLRETQNNFLLCTSDLGFETITKRSLPAEVDGTRARALFEHFVQPPEKRPTGFPVLEAPPVPVLAVEPSAPPPPLPLSDQRMTP